MPIQCNCCGNYYPMKHMVKKNSSNEVYYIPHAIRIFGLFKRPQEIRTKLDESELTDYLYILPGDNGYEFYNNEIIYKYMGGLPFGWRQSYSRFGNFYWLRND